MSARIWITLLVIASLFSLTGVGTAVAASVDGCPDGFHLHYVADHDHHDGSDEHTHKHIGNDKDLNGDNYLCVKHVGKGGIVHVHIDNNVPLN
jgi:hypothetical protein